MKWVKMMRKMNRRSRVLSRAVETLETRTLLAAPVFFVPVPYHAGLGPAGVAVGDFNNDKIPDLVVSDFSTPNTDDGGVSVLLGTGAGVFGSATPFLTNRNPKSVAVGDFNSD